jgi:hypothetical protein
VVPEQSAATHARQANSLPAICLQNGVGAEQPFMPSTAAGAHALVQAPVPTLGRESQ